MPQLKNTDYLTDEEMSFLKKETSPVNNEDNDGYAVNAVLKEPKFPKIIISVISVLYALIMFITVSIMSSLAKYSIFAKSDLIQAISDTKMGRKVGLNSLSDAVALYDSRFIIYLALTVICAIMIVTAIIIWKIRHNNWEANIFLKDDDDEENIDENEDN